jgi:hypothetical protein
MYHALSFMAGWNCAIVRITNRVHNRLPKQCCIKSTNPGVANSYRDIAEASFDIHDIA